MPACCNAANRACTDTMLVCEVLSFEVTGQAMYSFCLSLVVCFGEKEQDTYTVDDESLIQQQKHMSLVNVCHGDMASLTLRW